MVDKIPLAGHIFYTNFNELKIGDGVRTASELPALNTRVIQDVLSENKDLVLGNGSIFFDTVERLIYIGDGTTKLENLAPATSKPEELNIATEEATNTMLNNTFA